jgi:flagellar hook protein FlgE
MLRIIFPIIFAVLFSRCSIDNSVQPTPASSGTHDSIREFILDSLAAHDTLVGLDTAANRYYFQQGNLKSTGNIFDLAISGDALFVLKLDSTDYYLKRPGKFFVDKDGYVVREFNGPRLLGWKSDSASVLRSGLFSVSDSTLVPINIPAVNLYSPARATTLVAYSGNLNSDGEAWGTILYTQPFYHRADEFNTSANSFGAGVDNNIGAGGVQGAAPVTFGNIATDLSAQYSIKLTGLFNGSGQSLQIKTGDQIGRASCRERVSVPV